MKTLPKTEGGCFKFYCARHFSEIYCKLLKNCSVIKLGK